MNLKSARSFLATWLCFFIILHLLPYFLEEWGEALERGRLNARREDRENERRIRSGITGSGSNVVKLHDVSSTPQRGPESGA